MQRPYLIATLALALLAGCSKKDQQHPPEAKRPPAQMELTGEALFNERCRDCHIVNDKGGVVGPELSHVGSKRDRRFLEQVIREPAKVYPGTAMPPYDTFSKKQIDSLVDYLSGLK
ncbi:cytochrome c [Geomonas sp. Red69]|uniref:Cytochrome c n=1 Tax=Geomonas diazotrophica TaxID=2843197 RepID=A0ABX8JRA9_9BACT|nr:cytochrome c [Geomonas diazotrophica]QWV99676.1 cytochrome c [Geomonas nitrogeniifigens]QXE88813.1 cytochrome c [Geomonas nitrogeniifigens]